MTRYWRPIGICAAAAQLLAPAAAFAQQIAADRPGIGADPDIVPLFTLQPEIGSDTRELRLGVLKGFELDRDDTSWGAKLALVGGGRLKLSVQASRGDDARIVIEAPASYSFSRWFYLGTDVIWSRAAQTYAGEFNLTPTRRLTLTPTLYYDTKGHGAIFAAWLLPGHDNVQVDIGYNQRQLSAGISTALDVAGLFRRR